MKDNINWQQAGVQDIVDFIDKKILELEERLTKYKKARAILVSSYEEKKESKNGKAHKVDRKGQKGFKNDGREGANRERNGSLS